MVHVKVNNGGDKKTKPKFERVLGNLGSASVSIGGIIGLGIFFIIGIASDKAGSAVILSSILAGIIALFTSLSFASLGSKITKEGGEYQFIYIAFGRLYLINRRYSDRYSRNNLEEIGKRQIEL